MVATNSQLAVCCALFTVTLLARDHWGESDSPAIQARTRYATTSMSPVVGYRSWPNIVSGKPCWLGVLRGSGPDISALMVR